MRLKIIFGLCLVMLSLSPVAVGQASRDVRHTPIPSQFQPDTLRKTVPQAHSPCQSVEIRFTWIEKNRTNSSSFLLYHKSDDNTQAVEKVWTRLSIVRTNPADFSPWLQRMVHRYGLPLGVLMGVDNTGAETLVFRGLIRNPEWIWECESCGIPEVTRLYERVLKEVRFYSIQ
jgi:hypothetical protein